MPRVIAGGQQLKELVANASSDKVVAFLKDEAPSLERAMNLYGFSLRKGEYPDEISKTAEKLTTEFSKEVEQLSKTKDVEEQLQKVQTAFDAYAKFAKIEY